jgi:hypothetical protein
MNLKDSIIYVLNYLCSESCLGSITIDWNLPVFVQILKHMCGCPLDITTENVLSLYEVHGLFTFMYPTFYLFILM